MKRMAYTAIILLVLTTGYGQRYMTRTGHVAFEASVASFEEVAAENKSVSAVLEASTGEIGVLALMRGFRFKVALMEEHFNENYAESDTYPKATFKGKLEGFSLAAVKAGKSIFPISGDLTLHGKTKTINDKATVYVSGNTITITGNFKVKPGDFGIEIPKIVSKKIADTVTVQYNLTVTN